MGNGEGETADMQSLQAVLCGLVLASAGVRAADDYVLGPDSVARGPGVPEGKVTGFRFEASEVFPGTTRDCWVYVPAQYDGTQPAAVMVFQDGHAYVGTSGGGQMRVPVVFDNLIARGEMPVTIGVFVNPGHRGGDEPPREGWGNRSNRSVEYDSLGDAYARFLIDELLPHVERTFQVRISKDPELRAICGMSSGGICAWTVAWERPDSFGKVLSHIGSFTNIRGGHVYPALIRKADRKPIRVFLQDGSNDLNNQHGSWPLANQEMAAALAFAGYDHRFEFGDGAHNGKHGGAILPDSLRWLWRPTVEGKAKGGAAEPVPDMAEVVAGVGADGWEVVGSGYGFTDAACVDGQGNFHFADLPRGVVYRVAAGGGGPEVWLDGGPKISGMKFGPDGRLYACVQGEGTNNVKRIVAIHPGTKEVETLATSVQPNDLVVAGNGFLYFTDTAAGAVVKVPLKARGMSRPPVVAGGIQRPNGISLSPDHRHLWVSEYGGTRVWRFRFAEDGTLAGGERLGRLRTPADKEDSGGDGAATDSVGRVYVTSHLGVQVLDEGGRWMGTIARPQEKATVSCALGGEGRAWLYVCSSDRVYRRRMVARGGP